MGKYNIDLIRNIINLINDIFDNNRDLVNINIESLYEHGSKEDIVEILETLNTIKKTNINKAIKMIKNDQKSKDDKKKNTNKDIKSDYSNDEIFKIFHDLSDEGITSKLKLAELQSMYLCLYSEKPSSSKTKQDIVDTIRNYIYTSNRANAFRL